MVGPMDRPDGQVSPADMGTADTSPMDMVGRATLSPEIFQFDFVEVGSVDQRSVVIRNAGMGPLSLREFAPAFGSDYTLYWQEGTGERPLNEQTVGVLNGQNQMPDDISLAPDEAVTLTLVYRPTADGLRGGQFVFRADREIRIPIEHSDDRPRFVPEPAVVNLENVPLGERKLTLLSVRNDGTAIATLESVSLTGDAQFSIRIGGRDPEVDMRALHNPDRDLEQGVGIGKTFEVEIRFLAKEAGEYAAQIRVVSDAENGDITIPVTATAVPMD